MEELWILLQKMIFIYNAVISGWTVKYLGNQRFEFKQRRADMGEEVLLDNYLKRFIKDNLEGNKII